MSVNPTNVARLLDAIPLVASIADRDERFPSPDLYQRVQRRDTGCVQYWTGAAWADLLCPGEAGDGAPADPSCPVYCGTGSPEGVVTAAVGSLYYQRDAASTTHPAWFKRSGTGPTGWVAYAGHRGAGATSLAIGDASTAAGADGLALGRAATAGAADVIAVGRSASSAVATSIVIGQGAAASNAGATGVPHVVIGAGAYSESDDGDVVIGHGAYAKGVGRNQVIGYGAWTYMEGEAGRATAGGFTSREGHHTTVIGYQAGGGGDCSVCIGFDTHTLHDECVAIGTHAVAVKFGSVALGRYAFGGAEGSIAIGRRAGVNSALHVGAITLGVRSFTRAANTLNLGGPAAPLGGDPPMHLTAVHFNTSATPALLLDTAGNLTEVRVGGTKVLGAQQAARADTSGATLAALEAEVNALKAVLRAHGLLAT